MRNAKELKQAVQRLKADGLVLREEVTGKHWVLVLVNGLRYVRSCSPSDWRSQRNMTAEVRRMCRTNNTQP